MEYVLVDSRRVWACVYRRMPGGVGTDAIYGIGETVDSTRSEAAYRSRSCTPEPAGC